VRWTVTGILIPALLETFFNEKIFGRKNKRMLVLGYIPTIGGMVMVG